MPEWDDIFAEQGRVFTEPHPYMESLIQIFKKHDVKRVLDLGCGTGRHLVCLSREGFEVIGLDSSPKALELARKWLHDENLSADIIQQRMEHRFPFENDTFDAIVTTQVIHHNLQADIERTVGEMVRVLREGGIVFVSVPAYQESPTSPKEDWNLLKVEDNTYIPRSGPESGIPHHYFTTDELRRVFHAFEIASVWIDETGHICVLGRRK